MAQCLAFDPAASAVVAVGDPCTTFVALTPAEYAALSANPFLLDAADGFLIGAAVVGVWAAAFAWRAAIKALGADDNGSTD